MQCPPSSSCHGHEGHGASQELSAVPAGLVLHGSEGEDGSVFT